MRVENTGSRRPELPPTQEVEETDLPDYVPLRQVSYNDLSPLSSEPILIPGEPLANTLSPGDSQKNLSRSFEDSRPRSLEMEIEKDSTNSKGRSVWMLKPEDKSIILL